MSLLPPRDAQPGPDELFAWAPFGVVVVSSAGDIRYANPALSVILALGEPITPAMPLADVLPATWLETAALTALLGADGGTQSYHHAVVAALARADVVHAVVPPAAARWQEIDRPEDIGAWERAHAGASVAP